jgi:small-conductance mechanosensitive channel
MAAIALTRAGVASDAMPGVDSITIASFLTDHEDEITAIATVIAAFLIAEIVDRLMSKRALKVSAAVAGGELSPVATTRLRLVRRLIFATIVVVGLGLGLAQLPAVKSVAAGILASSAVLGLVVGFAARQTLANGIAGILLAITQPIRIGDLVTFEDQTGEVEDVQLTYTYIRLDDGSRLIVPNERLAQSSIENHTVIDPRVKVEVSIWVAPDTDLDAALALVASEQDGVSAVVAESDKEGVRLTATTWASTPRERAKVATELRRRWLRELREHSLSSVRSS